MIIRKWCDPKELSKARSLYGQKQQRKIREKRREIVKLKEEIEDTRLVLENVAKGLTQPESHTTPNENMTGLNVQANNTKENELVEKILKANKAVEQCNVRLEELAHITEERKATESREDQMLAALRYWCVLLRLHVFVPTTQELAKKSCPVLSFSCKSANDLLSSPIREVLADAKKFGISDLPDVSLVEKLFQCIAWCLIAFTSLRRKPKIDELKCILKLAESVALPEVKSIGMIKSMISRASPWQVKVSKALAPIPGETKPFDMQVLKELRNNMILIPIKYPEESKLLNAISDGGSRHCHCGGANDGRFMLCCDKCDKWFHGDCVNVQEEDSIKITNWICPDCSKLCNNVKSISIARRNKSSSSSSLPKAKVYYIQANDDISPNAPNPEKLWPPFGLSDSAEAFTALGTAATLTLNQVEYPHLPLLGNNDIRSGTVSIPQKQVHQTKINVSKYPGPFASTNFMENSSISESSGPTSIKSQNYPSNLFAQTNHMFEMSLRQTPGIAHSQILTQSNTPLGSIRVPNTPGNNFPPNIPMSNDTAQMVKSLQLLSGKRNLSSIHEMDNACVSSIFTKHMQTPIETPSEKFEQEKIE
mmetsp:Transcript_5259/g.7657  ORF Transcript_5259/g.7657 Transcript_5259/m.7657 type:complete len:594 (+) Transcript_5259:1165-2946(+)